MKNIKFIRLIAVLCFLFCAGGVSAQQSQIFIDVGQAQVKKSLLALTPLLYVGTQPTNRDHIEAGVNLYRVVYNDLSVSNLFTFVKPEAYLEDPNKVGLKPAPGAPGGFNFANWKTIGTEFLVRAAYQVIGKDLTMEVYVYHVSSAKVVLAQSYKGDLSSTRRIAHTFANDLMAALTGKKGMFISKIVATRQAAKNTNKEVWVMDWDGANPDKITAHDSISLSPAWATKGDKIAYTNYAFHTKEKVRNPDLFIFDLKTRQRFLVSYRKGVNSGAAFLPGDREMLITLSKDGVTDIYRMSTDGRDLKALTNGPNRAMNVEPAVSPDGKQIAFSSDRLGRPMIFTMNYDGSNVKRISFKDSKYNSTPSWSPDGKTIAFALLDSDHFDIFTMNLNGGDLKRITSAKKPNGRAANNESPSWSPDGRHILFTSDRSGKYQLYIISPDGSNERPITNDSFNWDKPKWSPFLN